MSLAHDEIINIMKMFRESKFTNLHLESGDFKLVLSKDGLATAVQYAPGPSGAAPLGPEALTPGLAEPAGPGPAPSPALQAAGLDYDQIERDGLRVFESPLLGVFYRAPNPGADPFVEEGSPVEEGTTLCIIEVMKLYTSVAAGLKGEVVKILAIDGEMVEYGQPLFLIKPQAAPDSD
jgi:acetyl-CoA carboxylase biotin carboxyl carrier protein